MSERLEPAALARVLNGYFQRMSDAIHDNRGHVSTFLGDGILAYLGALQPNPWQCDDAVNAGLAMQAAMRKGCRRSRWGLASTVAPGWPVWWARASAWSTPSSGAP